MKMYKKLVALFLVFTIIITNLNLNVLAQNETGNVTDTEKNKLTVEENSDFPEKREATYFDKNGNEVAPGFYESMIEFQNELNIEENNTKTRSVSNSEIETAGEELRAGMVARKADVKIKVNNGSMWDETELSDKVLSEALKETENGNEGDYLRYDIKSSEVTVSSSGTDYELNYTFSYYTSYEQEEEIEAAIADIINILKITDETSDFDKIKKIYEWITFNVEYDWDNVLTDYDLQYSAYAAVVDRIAVCQGYSKLLYRMLKDVGIENRLILGETGVENILHMWNIVWLDGKYYFCDSTSENAGFYDFFLKGKYDFPGYSCYDEYYQKFDIAENGYPVSSEDSMTRDGFVYQVVAEEVLIKGYEGDNPDVIVPAEIEGYPVKEIAKNTFAYNDTIKSLAFSEGIERINSESVFHCNNLEKIHFPSTMIFEVSVDSQIITGVAAVPEYCVKLQEISIAEENPYATIYDGALYTKDMSALVFYPAGDQKKEIKIPEGVVKINDSACTGNNYVEKIIMPDTVDYIGYWAFNGSSQLKECNISKSTRIIGQFVFGLSKISKIDIPASTEVILPDAFCDMSQLEEISVSENNSIYYEEENVLLNQEGLFCYPPQKKETFYKTPDNVKKILQGAFRNAWNLKNVELNMGLEVIQSQAFSDCYYLREMEVPDTVTTIESYAFFCNGGADGIRYIIIPSSVTMSGANIVSEGTIIYGEPGSAIEEYANNNNFYFADVNQLTISGKCGVNIEWNLDREGSLKISGKGKFYDYDSENSPLHKMSKNILNIEISEDVEYIGSYAFNRLWRVETIQVPRSVVSISETAFENIHSNCRIVGYRNSYAEEYANQHSITFEIIECDSDKHVKETIAGKEATCKEKGYTERIICSVCEKVFQEAEEIAVLGHEWDANDQCIQCSEEKPYAPLAYCEPTIVVEYTGKPVVIDEKNIIRFAETTGEVKYTYYEDSECNTPTYKGKTTEGTAPVEIGRYYIKGTVSSDEVYRETTSSDVCELTIVPSFMEDINLTNQKSGIKISWEQVPKADGYMIYRKIYGSQDDLKKIKTIANNTTLDWTDKDISQGARYMYAVFPYKKVANGEKILGDSTLKQIVRVKIKSTTNQNGSVKITWNKVPEVVGYKVYRKAQGSEKYVMIKNIKDGATTSYTDKTEKTIRNGKKSIYKIVPYYKNSSVVELASNTVTHYYLTRQKISSVTAAKKAFTVKWTKNSSATGYEVWYSTSSSFTSSTTKKKTYSSNSTINKKYTGLKAGKKYYVKVRSYKTVNGTKYYSAWSGYKSVKTK